MEIFIVFMFWYFVLRVVLRFVILSTSKYPRTSTVEIGTDVAGILIAVAILVWVSFLKYY